MVVFLFFQGGYLRPELVSTHNTVLHGIKSLFLHLQYNVFRGLHRRITNLTGKEGKMLDGQMYYLRLFYTLCVIAVCMMPAQIYLFNQ